MVRSRVLKPDFATERSPAASLTVEGVPKYFSSTVISAAPG
jgi:hypothetical protein